MSKFMELVKRVVEQKIPVTLDWNSSRGTMYANLNFEAKSHGHLYEQGDGSLILEMRYGVTENIEEFSDLLYAFKSALHGREYGSSMWFNLCEKHGVLERVIETKTTYR